MNVKNTVKLALFEDPKYGDVMSLWAKLEALAQEAVALVSQVGPQVVTLINEILAILNPPTPAPTPTPVTRELVEAQAKKLGFTFNLSVITDVLALVQDVASLAAQWGPSVWALVQKIISDLTPVPTPPNAWKHWAAVPTPVPTPAN